MDWIDLAQDRDQWGAVAINLLVAWDVEKFLSS
jgi:hypothetical protein